MNTLRSSRFCKDGGNLRGIAAAVRGTLIEISQRGGAPHIGSALSCVDILVAAYWRVMRFDPSNVDDPMRDRLIFSKGHAVTALYAALAHRGAIPWEMLASFNEDGGRLAEHPGPRCAPGIEIGAGSLGHGLPVGLGMAKAAKIQGVPNRVYVVMGDGECNEGSVWEAAMLAPAIGCNNLCAVVDCNGWQATGRTDEITAFEPFVDKWRAFGWETREVDGHDIDALALAMGGIPFDSGKPLAVIARTMKGKGVSFMEDDNNWHYKLCDETSLNRAFEELGLS